MTEQATENSTIIVTINDNGIARLTLNQPEIHNAFDEVLIADLTTAILELDNNPSVKVLMLDANGKSFSAGANLNWMRKMADYSKQENYQDSILLANLMCALFNMKCPTIAVIQGAAFGGGVGLVACCDIAVASEKASFCLSEVKLGLIPAVISPYVVKAIGERAAKRYFVTAERFKAKRAAEIGLVSEVVIAEELETRALELAKIITTNSNIAVINAKQLINDVVNKPITEEIRLMTADRIATIRASTVGKEGVSAFLEKRQPNWDQE
jgi:methylglutaconyl-CoA hydratase